VQAYAIGKHTDCDSAKGAVHTALIAAVADQSPASMAGLRPGDVITELDDEYIDSPAMLVLMLTRLPIGNEVTLTVLREDDVIQVPIRVGRRPRE